MEMTHREPQTPLFPPSYVNLVNAKDHWKIGESEHNTVTLQSRSLIVTPPTFAYTRPCFRQATNQTCTAESSEVLLVLWRNKRGQQRKWQIMEINVMFQAVQGMWSARMGWCLYSERHGNQITHSNKITRAPKETWLAVTLQYIRFHLPHKQSKERWGWWWMIYRSWAPLTIVWSCRKCGKY